MGNQYQNDYSPEQLKSKMENKHGYIYTYPDLTGCNTQSLISIHCPKHDHYFSLNIITHLKGQRCAFCARESFISKRQLPEITFHQRVFDLHNNKIDLSQFEYSGAKEKGWARCTIHNHLFKIKARLLYRESTANPCPLCASEARGQFLLELNTKLGKAGKTENLIYDILRDLGYTVERQVTFDGCIYQKHLLFDFYLPEINTAIEYDGEQHTDPNNWLNRKPGKFEERQIKDQIKDEYCQEQGIHLIRIPYTTESLEDYLRKHLP